MKNYEVLDHKADLKIKARGKNCRDLFLHMLYGMEESQGPEIKDQQAERRISVSSPDIESLLVDFLNEALYLGQTHKETYQDFKKEEVTEQKIKGVLIGKKVEGWEKEIKAATYHDLKIEKKENGLLEATIIFDV